MMFEAKNVSKRPIAFQTNLKHFISKMLKHSKNISPKAIIPKGGTKQSNQRGSGNLNLSINGESQMRQINNEK